MSGGDLGPSGTFHRPPRASRSPPEGRPAGVSNPPISDDASPLGVATTLALTSPAPSPLDPQDAINSQVVRCQR